MTAYPVTCLVDYEDGYRTVITLEEPSDADTEMGAIARLRIMTDDGKALQVGLSPEAAEALERRLRELRGSPESVATSLETGAELHRSVGRRQMMTTSDPTTTDAVAMLQRMHARAVHSANRGEVPRISSAELLAVLRATQDERARHAEEVARLRDVHLDETRALDDLRLKEIASLRDQLRRTEGARDVATRVAADHFGTICQLRDQLRKVEGERDTLAVRMDLPASQLLMVGSELCGDGKIDPNDHRDPRWTPTLQQAAKVMRELTSIRALLPDVRACAEYCRNILIGPPGMPVEDYPLAPVALAARRILAALDSHECPECHMVERCKMSCSRGGSKGARVSVSPREGGE